MADVVVLSSSDYLPPPPPQWLLENNFHVLTSAVLLYFTVIIHCNNSKKRKHNIHKETESAMSDKFSKGLRHFSLKVCEKVEQKQSTTYNEVMNIEIVLPSFLRSSLHSNALLWQRTSYSNHFKNNTTSHHTMLYHYVTSKVADELVLEFQNNIEKYTYVEEVENLLTDAECHVIQWMLVN